MDLKLATGVKPSMVTTEPSTEDVSRIKRHATLYDAVAGRVGAHGFVSQSPSFTGTRDTSTASQAIVPPETVLFRRRNAPIRYEEDDFYFASDRLEPEELPNSDLLKALHSYASDFYSRAVSRRPGVDFKSLDETALLALGVLMEEMCRESLGRTGDLALAEGLASTDVDGNAISDIERSSPPCPQIVRRSGQVNKAKRRRLSPTRRETD